MPNRCIQKGDNEDLTEERRLCPFDTDELGAQVWGGPDQVKRRHEIQAFVEKTPELANTTTDFSFMSRIEQVENVYRNMLKLLKYKDQAIDPTKIEEAYHLNALLIGPQGFPLSLHYTMVIPMLMNNADDEQVEWWLQKAMNREFVGTYAQTEMGHGTNLKKLETTATYDPKTEQFVLNSPTVTSTKWWPGNLGKSSNFIMVMAQLWTQGKCHGAYPFMVQIRDFNTHEPLNGVTVGDIGPKYGTGSNDNGFLRLSNVRIPRRNMLMRHAKVHPDGRFEPPMHAKLSYTGMMYIRAIMIHGIGQNLAQAATIATRYSCVRKQGEILEGKGEVKILDYTTQQYRILPQLSRSFCFMFSGEFIREMYFKNMQQVNSGDTSLMADLHALSSGLKSVVTFQTAQGIEQCRMSCGGHGYSMASGIPQIFAVMVGGCTYEGENLVMLLQLARYLMKIAKQVRSGQNENASPLVAYFFKYSGSKSSLSKSQTHSEQWADIQKGFELVSRQLTLRAFDRLQQLKSKGMVHELAWNKIHLDLTRAARAHTRTFLSRNFIQKVQSQKSHSIRAILSDLLHLYLHYEVQDCRADLLEFGYISPEQLDVSRDELEESLKAIRKNAVNIVDSLNFPDRELNSCLGRRDGHVYENLFKWAQQSELNRTQVLPFHHETLGKMMKEAKKEGSKL